MDQAIAPSISVQVDDALVAAIDDVRSRLLKNGTVMPSREVVVEAITRMSMADPSARTHITELVAAFIELRHGHNTGSA